MSIVPDFHNLSLHATFTTLWAHADLGDTTGLGLFQTFLKLMHQFFKNTLFLSLSTPLKTEMGKKGGQIFKVINASLAQY